MEGETITNIREMTDGEYSELGFPPDNTGAAMMIELSNGAKLYPSTDPEGNSTGSFHWQPDASIEELVGLKIESLLQMADEGVEMLGWPEIDGMNPPVITLEDGTTIYPAANTQNNGPGELFKITPELDDGMYKHVSFTEDTEQ